MPPHLMGQFSPYGYAYGVPMGGMPMGGVPMTFGASQAGIEHYNTHGDIRPDTMHGLGIARAHREGSRDGQDFAAPIGFGIGGLSGAWAGAKVGAAIGSLGGGSMLAGQIGEFFGGKFALADEAVAGGYPGRSLDEKIMREFQQNYQA